MVKKYIATLSNGTTRLFEGVSFKDAWNHARSVVKPDGLKLTDFRLEGKSVKMTPKMKANVQETNDDTTVVKSEKVEKKVPMSYFRPVRYQVSDPNDPHHYEFVEEVFGTEAERERRVIEVKTDKKLTYISKGYNFKKWSVNYWKQID